MTKRNSIILAALGGAAIAALIANYLSTEKGKELLATASNTLKNLSTQATDYAKANIGEVIAETKNTLGDVVKEKISQKVSH